jgi:hypothetical protein
MFINSVRNDEKKEGMRLVQEDFVARYSKAAQNAAWILSLPDYVQSGVREAW